MSDAHVQFRADLPHNSSAISKNTAGRGALALIGFLGGFVIFEPAPYEAVVLASAALALLFGMRFGFHSIWLLCLFGLFNLGGLISISMLSVFKEASLYIAVSAYLGLSAVFVCASIASDMLRLRWLMRGYVVGAVTTAALGIAGYFHLFAGADAFTRYGRAMGVFQDPNVFGPFLVLPLLYLLYGVLQRSLTLAPVRAAMVLIIAGGIFLSFSRAAWGLTLLSGTILYFLILATEPSPRNRLRLLALGGSGVIALIMALIVALQFDAVADMVAVRAKVVQEYDGAETGRFARHAIGFFMAMTHPIGVGPLEFGKIIGEDPHNIWVKSLMSYGWLGFFSYLTLVSTTLVGGFRILGKRRPWQPFLFCAYAAFLGHIPLAWVIDIDHWRHVYLLYGIIWGCMALEANHAKSVRTQADQTI